MIIFLAHRVRLYYIFDIHCATFVLICSNNQTFDIKNCPYIVNPRCFFCCCCGGGFSKITYLQKSFSAD